MSEQRLEIDGARVELDCEWENLKAEKIAIAEKNSQLEKHLGQLGDIEQAQQKLDSQCKELQQVEARLGAERSGFEQQREELEAGREQLDSERKRLEVDMQLLRSEREHPEEAANESANSGDDFHLEDDEDPDSVSEYMEQLLTRARKKRDHNEESGNPTLTVACFIVVSSLLTRGVWGDSLSWLFGWITGAATALMGGLLAHSVLLMRRTNSAKQTADRSPDLSKTVLTTKDLEAVAQRTFGVKPE